jgi:molecular chaperone DnaK
MVKGGKMSVVVPKNCAIPTRVTRTYSTTVNYQSAVMIEIFQGESDDVLDNAYLGSFELGKLPLLPAGQVQVDVSFEMNADGVLEVSARENSTGREASVTITAAGGLADADVEKLAERHRAVAARS